MIPTNSSGTTNGCDNISSNCVIWQGPDISCIDLCNGDSISEVVFKLATKVCDLLASGVDVNPNLNGLDISCLNVRGATPTQLVPVLQAMVNQICLNALPSGGTKSTSTLPVMTLPACMQYNDASGNPVTQLPLDQFATLIANQVCTNLASINTINSTSLIFLKIPNLAVGILYFSHKFLVNILEPSSRDALLLGPNTLILFFSRKSTIPFTNGFSGPTITKSILLEIIKFFNPSKSSILIEMF